MKPLLVLARITFVGCLWSIIFIEGIRVIVLENWRFDIFWPAHWAYAWNLWQSGWIIDTPKEWAFILILVTFIPLWLTGWVALSLIPFETIIYRIVSFPFKFIKGSVEPLAQAVSSTPVVIKKKSYKEVRPAGKRMPIYEYNNTTITQTAPAVPAITHQEPVAKVTYNNPVKEKAVSARETLNHTIFDLDDEDDDFDLDIDSFDKSDIFKIDSEKKKKEARYEPDYEEDTRRAAKISSKNARFDFDDEDDEDLASYEPVQKFSRNKKKVRDTSYDEDFSYSKRKDNRRSDNEMSERTRDRSDKNRSDRQRGGSIGDVLEEKGYDVLHNVQFKKTMVDYVAVCSDKVLLCLVDKEVGDWLADEERFNDEEPLWFSENSHRISPVRKVDSVREKMERLLDDSDLDLEVKPYVVVVAANIINAEDMADVWSDMDVCVARFAKGTPAELPAFIKTVDRADGRLSKDEMSDFRAILKKLM